MYLQPTRIEVVYHAQSCQGHHQFAAYVDRLVSSGDYAFASDVVRAGLRALQARDAAMERWLDAEVGSVFDRLQHAQESGVSLSDVFAEIRASDREGAAVKKGNNFMLSDEEVIARIERAFEPFRCVAQVYDYRDKIGFQIFDEDESTLLTFSKLNLASMQQEKELERMISRVQFEIESNMSARAVEN